jgi:MOSC domain-containing protein YiiM
VKVLSVNVGLPRDVEWRGRRYETAIFKTPVGGRVRVVGFNLEGDRQADPSVHGGPDKAVYGYPIEHYPFWQSVLETGDLGWGAFGENLTTEGLLEEDVLIGDRFRIGSVELVVTQPRIPCHKLALRHRRPDLPKRFLASGRSGFYFAVAREGELGAGDAIERVARDPGDLSVADVNRIARGEADAALTRRAAEHPALAEVWREELRERLAKALP